MFYIIPTSYVCHLSTLRCHGWFSERCASSPSNWLSLPASNLFSFPLGFPNYSRSISQSARLTQQSMKDCGYFLPPEQTLSTTLSSDLSILYEVVGGREWTANGLSLVRKEASEQEGGEWKATARGMEEQMEIFSKSVGVCKKKMKREEGRRQRRWHWCWWL